MQAQGAEVLVDCKEGLLGAGEAGLKVGYVALGEASVREVSWVVSGDEDGTGRDLVADRFPLSG